MTLYLTIHYENKSVVVEDLQGKETIYEIIKHLRSQNKIIAMNIYSFNSYMECLLIQSFFVNLLLFT